MQGCPQCVQYCYKRIIICRNGQEVSVLSQVKPYRPDDEQAVEWSNIQAAERNTQQRFASAKEVWRPLSPYAELGIFGCFILISTLAWFGREKNGTHLNDWGLNIPLNAYFAFSLLTFNTALDSNALVQMADQYVLFHSWLFIVAVLAFFGINAMSLARGWDYLFVKHPAEPIVNEAVSSGTAIDNHALTAALTLNPAEIHDPMPAWHYEHQAEKARKLAEKLDRDTELARAAIARERARTELQDEQETSAANLRERVWRGGTLK
jgi:hypothetical protein